MNQDLYRRLREVAADEHYIRYFEVGALVGLDMTDVADREEISRLLDEISEYEHQHNRPLLSAIVIHVEDNIPGNGFFSMAERLGRFRGNDRLRFWLHELRAVYDHWARPNA